MRKIAGIVAGCVLLMGLLLTANAADTADTVNTESETVDTQQVQSAGNILEKSTVYNSIIGYLQKIDESPWVQGGLEEGLFYFVLDLVLSFFCLWVVVWFFTREVKVVSRRYFWFISFFNLSWFCMLIFLKGLWMLLDYLVVRLQPDTIGVVLNNYVSLVFVCAFLLYVWILARTFGLTSLTAFGTLAVSHTLYLVLIFMFLAFMVPAGSPLFKNVSNNFGIKPIVYGYLSDVEKVISSNDILGFIRIRPFHL